MSTHAEREYVHKRTPDPEHDDTAMSPIRPEESAHALLHDVVMAVINAGHASDFYDFPDVLAYFEAQLPKKG